MGGIMKLVYIAGPYRAENRLKVRWNIIKAKQRGVQVILQCLNCYPVIPHMNTAEFDFEPLLEHVAGDRFYLDGTIALMDKCDAVLLTAPDADKHSSGTAGEVARAELLGLPVFRTLTDLKRWANGEHGLARNAGA